MCFCRYPLHECGALAGVIQSPNHRIVHGCPLHAATDSDIDTVGGERVLRETRDDREQKARLREIEDQLALLTSSRVDEVHESLSSFICSVIQDCRHVRLCS